MNILKLVLSVLLLYSSSSFAADEIHWTIMGQTAVTFDWRGSSSEDSISYGTKSGEYSKKVTAYTPKPRPYSSSGPFWEAKITGLKENTRYYYSISNGSEATFKTPPPRGSSGYTIVAEGDIGDTGTYFEVGAVQDMVADQKPEFVLVLGDLAYGDQHGDEAVDQHFNDLMVWSRDAAFMPVWGNHEWGDSDDDLRNYKGRFDLPNSQASPNAPSNGCCGEDWFWFDYGNVRYIGVPEPYSRAWSDWQKKAAVLMAEAQSDSDITFIVTMVHRAAYSSGSHSGSLSLKERLDELGDDYSKYALNLNGHSHNYERSHPQHGVVHVTAGGSGSSLGDKGSCLWYTCKQPSWSAYRAMHLGVLKLDISANGIAGTYYCGPASKGENDVHCDIGDVMDKFSIGSPTPIQSTPEDSEPKPVPEPEPTPEPTPSTPVADGNSLVYTPTDDATIKYGSSSRNYGTAKLETDKSSLENFLIKFNISGIKGRTVTSAKLRLYNVNGSDKGGDFYQLTDNSWSESSVTWSNAPDTDSTAVATIGAVNVKQWITVDLSPAIKGDGIYSFRISSRSSNGADYLSKEDSQYAPQLTVTFSDEALDSPIPAPTPDTEAPSQPSNLQAVLTSDTDLSLSWSASTDNIEVNHYIIYRNAVQVDTSSTQSYADSALLAATEYNYKVIAVDEAGNQSEPSSTTIITAEKRVIEPEPDSKPMPQFLSFTPTDDATIKPGSPTRNYGTTKLETDKSSIEHFLIKFDVSGVNGRPVTSAKLRLYNVNGSDKGGDFNRVSDNSWSESSVTWDSAPDADSSAVATLGKVSVGDWVEVDLSAEITADGIYSYRVSSTSSNGADYKSKEVSDSNYAPQLIVTIDGTADNPDVSAPTSSDNEAPSQPGNFIAISKSTSQVDLSWSPSTDNVGISHYKVYRNSSKLASISNTIYSDSSLSPSTTYTYKVVAVDKAGNVSTESITSATTADEVPADDPVEVPVETGGVPLTFTPTDDATIKRDSPSRNYGSAKLETDKSSLENFLMKFNISGIDGRAVSSVKLRLYNVNGSNNGGNFYRAANNDWSESTVNWDTAPTADITAVATLGAVDVRVWVEVDLTSEIKADGIYSFRISSTSTNGADYKSKEDNDYAPQLIISFE